mgnify:CR=1 FL=1
MLHSISHLSIFPLSTFGHTTSRQRIKDEIDKLLSFGFIHLITGAMWLSDRCRTQENLKDPILVNYKKINTATICDAFPWGFTGKPFDILADHNMYNFIHVFSGYN